LYKYVKTLIHLCSFVGFCTISKRTIAQKCCCSQLQSVDTPCIYQSSLLRILEAMNCQRHNFLIDTSIDFPLYRPCKGHLFSDLWSTAPFLSEWRSRHEA